MEKSKTSNFQQLSNVEHVKEMVQSQVQVQTDVLIVVEMEECVQTKVFLLFNKHAHNVQVVVKK